MNLFARESYLLGAQEMPSNEEHSESTFINLGQRASDLHRWMDDPWKTHGQTHRRYRHNPSQPPEWAIRLYGRELTQNIMRDHVELDILETREKIGYQTEYSVIDEDESIVYFLKTKDNEVIITEEQIRVLKMGNVISTLLLADIDQIQLESRKQPTELSITITLLGIIFLIGFMFVENSIWFLGIGLFLTIAGFITLFYEKKVLVISQKSTSTSKEFLINTSTVNIENLILKIKELK